MFLRGEDLAFLVTNRLPRRWATLFMGWFSRIELEPIRRLSLAVWRAFAPDLNLREAKNASFSSVHDCFTRELKDGARPIDPDARTIVSPCDAIVGASGRINGQELIQAKGFPYTLRDLLGDDDLVARHRGGTYVTLRLTPSMYHRFHAPCDGRVSRVIYISGDTWNVNPIALRRVERLFCKNERAVIELAPPAPDLAITLVPVAAILVASLKLRFLSEVLDLQYRGPNVFACDATFRKGEELGYFELGSTIIVLASGPLALCGSVTHGARIRMGQPLFTCSAPIPSPDMSGAAGTGRPPTPVQPLDGGTR